jgi:hypothetical protein
LRSKRIAGVVAAGAIMVAVAPAAPASAINNIKGFGVQETLKDFYSLSDFRSEIGYTVRNLRPSSDPVPYPLAGRLFESDTMTTAVVGTVFPQPGNFRARTGNGADYRALPVSTLSGAPLGQGASNSGKLYFDVVGENPDSVVYNSGFEDLLGWVGPQPSGPVVPGTSSDGGGVSGGGAGGGGGAAGGSGPQLAQPPQIEEGGAGGPVEGNRPAGEAAS